MKVRIIGQPNEYFQLVGTDLSDQLCKKNELPDLIHLFVKNRDAFENQMKLVKRKMKPTTIVWVSWYKKSSGFATNISEDDIRKYALQNDLVDIKVCAVNEVWSGLKLVVPLSKRKQY